MQDSHEAKTLQLVMTLSWLSSIKPFYSTSLNAASRTADLDICTTFSPTSPLLISELTFSIAMMNASRSALRSWQCFDTVLHEAVIRKEGKYLQLLSACQQEGYTAKLIILEVGSHGLPNLCGFIKLKDELNISTIKTRNLLSQAAREAIISSFNSWCCRNTSEP